MEDNKKRPLSEEELEQVTGGVKSSVDESNGRQYWYCERCKKKFYTKSEAEEHEARCSGAAQKDKGYYKALAPLII